MDHDHSYKLLFSHQHMMADLVVNRRDFDMLEPLNSQQLVYTLSQAIVPHQRPTGRGA
jgi:hypothetical protein